MSETLRHLLVASVAVLLAGPWGPAHAAGDAAAGEKVFKKCAACHSVAADGGSKIGPNLRDVVGRRTAALDGFTYSPAMTKLGADGHEWTTEEIDKFLENPKKMVPATKMAFVGLKKPEERADVIAYLQSLAPTGAATASAPK